MNLSSLCKRMVRTETKMHSQKLNRAAKTERCWEPRRRPSGRVTSHKTKIDIYVCKCVCSFLPYLNYDLFLYIYLLLYSLTYIFILRFVSLFPCFLWKIFFFYSWILSMKLNCCGFYLSFTPECSPNFHIFSPVLYFIRFLAFILHLFVISFCLNIFHSHLFIGLFFRLGKLFFLHFAKRKNKHENIID